MKHNPYYKRIQKNAFRTVAIALLILLFSPTAWSQSEKSVGNTGDAYIERTQEKKTPLILPGAGKVNIEKLKGKIDTQMDISKLNLVELRAIRNAFAARQGYPFKDATLRALYNTTTWYNDALWDVYEKKRPLVKNSHHVIRKNNLPLQSASVHVKQNYESRTLNQRIVRTW